ncbi:MAG: tryptophan synthase subunit alpha [Clostridia bacterium]|nr:tryptophan synthase subunit alpha [Clostridia bacterium]
MKIKDAFENRKAFITFITCGDPNLETTEKLIVTMEKNGADIVELGIPFSDPTAEGPVIQAANIRALSGGVTTDKIFDMVRRVRPKVNIPLVFMTYANVVFSYGIERFAKACSDIGINGIILPDVPFEEKHEFSDIFDGMGVEFISLVAPTSDDRTTKIAEQAKGFLYCVSSLGVTGTRTSISDSISEIVSKAKEVSNVPAAVGFGISTPEQAAHIAQYADGIIIGSAIVKLIGKYGENSEEPVGEFCRSIRAVMRPQADTRSNFLIV